MAGGKLVGLVVVKNWCELRSTIVLRSLFSGQVRFYIFSSQGHRDCWLSFLKRGCQYSTMLDVIR